MIDLVQKALTAKRESRHVEFKAMFDPAAAGEWCELVKDIVAMANSGGGIIVFGLDSLGKPSAADFSALGRVDPADIVNKVGKYAGSTQLEIEVREVRKDNAALPAFVIQPVSIPIVFQKPGTYDAGSGKQHTAFGVGTVYFRHGAKSEPGTTDDIRVAIERQLENIRKSWVKGVRKVVQAPAGSQIVYDQPTGPGTSLLSGTVRAVRDPKATPVLLTRDREKANGTFVHEEISDGIFDEINNVVDANRALAQGQRRFFLGPQIYYRIYAERQHVVQRVDDIGLLLHGGMCEMYAPTLFWTLSLPDDVIAGAFTELYLDPKSPAVHWLIRIAVLLGGDFCEWLADKWQQKWRRYPQPPSFYLTFLEMKPRVNKADPRLLASRIKVSAQLEIDGAAVSVAELLEKPKLASSLLSKACMQVFRGATGDMRSTARTLDCLAYGLQVNEKSRSIANAICRVIGSRKPGDAKGDTAAE